MKQLILAIAEDIAKFFYDYADTGAKIAVVALIFYWCALFVRKVCLHKGILQARQIAVRSGFLFLLVVYLYILIGITILSRSVGENRYAYFELFRLFRDTIYDRKQVCENILLFMPYAVLLFGVHPIFRRGWLQFMIALLSSVAIESAQWLTYTGYFEIDDIWMNVLGMMIGYAGCTVIRLIYKNLRK